MYKIKKNYETLFSKLNCAISIIAADADLTINYANSAFYHALGLKAEEVRYRFADRLSAMLEPKVVKKLHDFIHHPGEQGVLSIEHMIRGKDLSQIWFMTEVNGLRLLEHGQLFLISYNIDRYKSNEQMYMGMLTQASYLMDNGGFDFLEYDCWMKRICEVKGSCFALDHLPCDIPFEKSMLDQGIIAPEDGEKFSQEVKRIKKDGDKTLFEVRMKTNDGGYRWARISLGCLKNGRRLSVLGIFTDISVEKEATMRYLDETLFYQSVLSDQDGYMHLDVTDSRILRVGGEWTLYSEVIGKVAVKELIEDFLDKVVLAEDRERCAEVMNRKHILDSFRNGITHLECEFRRFMEQNRVAWVKMTIHLFLHPMSGHIMTLVYIKTIDDNKRQPQVMDDGKPWELEAAGKDLGRQQIADIENGEQGSGSFDTFCGTHGDMAYLVNPKTYELICGNQAMYNRLGKNRQECRGRTCFALLHNRTRPCAFCRSANWSRDKFYIYRTYNEVLEQEFLIKNKLVTWKNQQVLFAVAVDLSNDKNLVNSIANDTDENANILSGIQSMQDSATTFDVMYAALETIGTFFRADRVRFWRHADKQGQYYCESCWSRRASEWSCTDIADKENQTINQWLKSQDQREALYVESQEAMLCSSFDMYNWMKESGIFNLRWVVFCIGDEIVGMIEVDNTTINFQNHSFLESFINFVAGEWKKRLLAEDMIYTSFHDALTGILNRSSYEMYLQKYNGDTVTSMAAVVININGLKHINAQQGLEIGNRYLKKMANIMVLAFGRSRVFRMNGDEFLALVPNEEQSYIESAVKSTRDMLSNENNFTAAIGYCWEDVEKSLEPIVETATHLMRMNKRNHYESGNISDNKERAEILGEILRFIEGNEMEVFMQPKIDVIQNKMVGAEALVRIRNEKQGIIPPVKFIGILEKNNLIRYVDLFVFEEVCRILDSWRRQGKECPVVSVNFSRVTLMELDLTDTMEQIVSKYQIEKRYIEIEITESFEDIGKSRLYQAARNMFKAGFSVSLDDFGTKYTNLSILSDIDVNVLKLDRSLICSMAGSEKNQVILKHVIEMCGELKVEVIAEGVETKEQEDILKNLGCYLIQGYLYSKPIEMKEFEEKFM